MSNKQISLLFRTQFGKLFRMELKPHAMSLHSLKMVLLVLLWKWLNESGHNNGLHFLSS